MQPLNNNNGYSDALSDISGSTSPSADSLGKPRHSYDSADDGLNSDLEDAFIKPTTGRKTPWWRSLGTRRKYSPELGGSLGPPAYSNRNRRSCWPNFCIFGSISGLGIV